jgi:protein SCO1/2
MRSSQLLVLIRQRLVSKKAVLKYLVLTACCLLITVSSLAQQLQHYNSPLYGPRPELNQTENGLPKVLKEVGIEQKLNEQLPLETKFRDENGQEVELQTYFQKGRPVVLALIYYECPMLCNEVLNGLTKSLKVLAFDTGKEFDVVAISFDSRETPELAKAKKESYLAKYARPNTEKGWHFLTGSQESIDKITNAVGFHYIWDEKTEQFAHAGGIMVITPEGKIARYFYGIEYAPKDLRLGLIEAAENKIGNPVDRLLLYCYHYDPATGKYGLAILNIIRLSGVITILGLGALLLILRRYNKNQSVVDLTQNNI